MNNDAFSLLDSLFSENKIRTDVASALEESKYVIQLDKKDILIKSGFDFDIVYKRLVVDHYDLFFTPIRICIALGGVSFEDKHIIKASDCFAFINYESSGNALSIDFDENFHS